MESIFEHKLPNFPSIPFSYLSENLVFVSDPRNKYTKGTQSYMQSSPSMPVDCGCLMATAPRERIHLAAHNHATLSASKVGRVGIWDAKVG